MNYAYETGILGGTFDHLHLGHQKLIDTAFEQSSRVTIGLTTTHMYQKKLLANSIEDYQTRRQHVETYLYEKGFIERADIIPLDDIYGNSLQESNIDAIFATEETLPNVEMINSKRRKKGFPKLKVIIVAFVKADDNRNITSERIRKGEIDREGFVYKNIFEQHKILTLPENLRAELQKPLSKLVKTTAEVLKISCNQLIITVGDIISGEMKKAEIEPIISIIDFKTRRHKLPRTTIKNAIRTINSPGAIHHEAVIAFTNALNNYFETEKPQTIIVDGEEDLLALPAILLAPLGSIVLYGQFDQGIVVNEVTEKLKEKIKQLLYTFD